MRLYAYKVDPGGKWHASYRIVGEHGMQYGLFWADGNPVKPGADNGLSPILVKRVIVERYPFDVDGRA